MQPESIHTNPFFHSFDQPIADYPVPENFALMHEDAPHPLCILAAEALQYHLDHEAEWDHNFGLGDNKNKMVIGKMFGVLVVKTTAGDIGYLKAFSGKLAGKNHHPTFVPPVFDSLADNSFVNSGMTELTRIIQNIKELEVEKPADYETKIKALKSRRKDHSVALQQQIFDHYHFLNKAGVERSLLELFKDASYKNPPSGAGECAGPKLLQYAFQHNMQPLAMAEFWWGLSPKSAFWKHGHYYACCKEKCEPILVHMLKGIDD